jgi:hypothetical protein
MRGGHALATDQPLRQIVLAEWLPWSPFVEALLAEAVEAGHTLSWRRSGFWFRCYMVLGTDDALNFAQIRYDRWLSCRLSEGCIRI